MSMTIDPLPPEPAGTSRRWNDLLLRNGIGARLELYCLQIGRLAEAGRLTPTVAGLAKMHNTRKARAGRRRATCSAATGSSLTTRSCGTWSTWRRSIPSRAPRPCRRSSSAAPSPASGLHRGQVGEHGHQPLLDDLETGQRLAELMALRRVAHGGAVSGGGVAQPRPGAGAP